MDRLTLYGSFTSSSSYKPMLYLALARLPFSFRTVNLKTGVQKTPEYLAINRWGVVPSLRHRGLPDFEVSGKRVTAVRLESGERVVADSVVNAESRNKWTTSPLVAAMAAAIRTPSGGTDRFDERRKRRIADQILFVPRAGRRQRDRAIEQRAPSLEEPKVC
jgi:glutathione S-transferase